LLDIPSRDLPMIWDADFMLGPSAADGTDSYVLAEINVSSVFPIPDGLRGTNEWDTVLHHDKD
jgi:hypothetical protein